MRPEEDEGRKIPESREIGIHEQWAEQRSEQNRAVNGSRGKPIAWMCGPRSRVGQRERMSQRSW